MRITQVLVSATVVSASALPADWNWGPAAVAESAEPELANLHLNRNAADAKADWDAIVPELKHVGIAKREANGGKGLGGCSGKDCGNRFYRESDFREHDRHHEHEDEGFEEHYWVEHIDGHRHDSHRHHHEHDHFDYYNRFNDTRDHHHHHHKVVAKREVDLPVGDVKVAKAGDGGKFFKERLSDFKEEDRTHRYHDHHDDVEFYREEIHRDHEHHHNGGHHHNDGYWDYYRPQHHHHHHDPKVVTTKKTAAAAEVAAREAKVNTDTKAKAAASAEGANFHQGLTDKHICGYFRGIAYRAHELQRPVEQFQYENVPWLVHNQGPWQHVLDGLRQIEWVLTKLNHGLKSTSGFTAKEERDLVGCYYTFAGINSPNGDRGEPFKQLLCLLASKARLARQEPYAQKRVYNVVKNLEKAYLSTGEQLARVLQQPKYKANILWDSESKDGIRGYFAQVLHLFDVDRH